MTAKTEKSKLMESTGGETMAMGVKYPTPEQGKLIIQPFSTLYGARWGRGLLLISLSPFESSVLVA